MRQYINQTLFAYWNEVRRERIAPHRFEIEPSRIVSILPHTFILERCGPLNCRFRLAGTRICEAFGLEFRGRDFAGLWAESDQSAVARILNGVTEEAAVGVLEFDVESDQGNRATYEAVIMPLRHTQAGITRLLGSMCAVDAPAWLEYQPVSIDGLGPVSMIWPDGRPRSIAEEDAGQAPFAAHISHARIVSRERRRFKVYEGGRRNGDVD